MRPRRERVFLGWDQPALHVASRSLWSISENNGDLSDLLVVVPGRRSGRQLLAMLVDVAIESCCALVPPSIITPGELTAFNRVFETRAAGPVARRLAWIEALRSTSPLFLEALLPVPPDPEDLNSWSRFAALLERSSTDLGAQGLRFEDVPERVEKEGAPGRTDPRRCQAAAHVQQCYVDELAQAQLHDPTLDVGEPDPGAGSATVALVCVTQVSAAARSILEAHDVVALVHAPETLSDRFDDIGCVRVDAWAEAPIEIEDERIVFAGSPGEQAARSLGALAGAEGEICVDDVVVAIAGDGLSDHALHAIERYTGTPGHLASGRTLRATSPARLLEAIGQYVEEPRFSVFASLARHPDLERLALDRGGSSEWWLDAFDAYQRETVAKHVDGTWRARGARRRALSHVYSIVAQVLEPIADLDPQSERPICDWARALLAVLSRIYGEREDVQGSLAAACIAWRDVLLELTADHFGHFRTKLTCAQALRLILDLYGPVAIPEESDPLELEVVGWLELHTDPSARAVLLGANEGALPEPVSPDPLLSDVLREECGLPCDRARLARDTYLLSAIQASRELTIFVGRTSELGDAEIPSRLLFRGDIDQSVARAQRYTLGDTLEAVPAPSHTPGSEDGFARPTPDRVDLTSLSVTAFRTYLESPYVFYLKHVLRLDDRGDDAAEIDPRGFGSLLHDVLEEFGSGEARDLTDAGQIEEFLLDDLTSRARSIFGRNPTAAVRVQIEVAQRRLRLFSAWQAESVRQGWRIERTEWGPSYSGAEFTVDGEPIALRGRIDRIDVNVETGRWRILDYKSGENVKSPDRSHRSRGTWKDLQLPLYRHLARELDPPSAVELGYIVLSREDSSIGLAPATWTAEDLDAADEAARGVVRSIREHRFDDIGSPRFVDGSLEAILAMRDARATT